MGIFSLQPQRQKHLTSGPQLPTLNVMPILPNNISSLTAAEKFELIDALWEDLEAHAATLSAEQAEELDRRIAAYEKNPPSGTPWEQVKAGLPMR
jgi:putative addiction module component (TIGR02574 family)